MVFLVLIVQSDSAASLLWENEVKKKKKCTCREDNGETRAHGHLFPGPQIIAQSLLSNPPLLRHHGAVFYLHLVIFTRRWALNPPEYEDDS